jgi:3-methyladenine DNA glycosylase AlkD
MFRRERLLAPIFCQNPKLFYISWRSQKNVWERRIAIIASSAFIKRGQSEITFKIADMLRHDNHDLIHKAVGWMLREVGKSCSRETLQRYLKPRYARMPRTMLRYAIEHFPQKLRTQYLEGKV